MLPALCPRLLRLIRIPKTTTHHASLPLLGHPPRFSATAGVHDLIGTLQLRVLLTPLRFRYSGTPGPLQVCYGESKRKKEAERGELHMTASLPRRDFLEHCRCA